MYSITLLAKDEAGMINSIRESSMFQLTVVTLFLVGSHSMYRLQKQLIYGNW
jgi:hypothetical protein